MSQELTPEEYREREARFAAAIHDVRQVLCDHNMDVGESLTCMAALQGQLLQEHDTPDNWPARIKAIAQLVNEQACWINPHQFGH